MSGQSRRAEGGEVGRGSRSLAVNVVEKSPCSARDHAGISANNVKASLDHGDPKTFACKGSDMKWGVLHYIVVHTQT